MFELLTVGTVPAMLEDTPFRTATFEPIPAIVGKTWRDVSVEIQRLLQPNAATELQALSTKGVQFYEKLRRCTAMDMEFILKGAFGRKSRGVEKQNK